MQRHRGRGALLLLGVLVAGSAGCSGDESDTSSAESTVPPSTAAITTGPSASTSEPESTAEVTESETTTSTVAASTTTTTSTSTTTTEAERSIEELEAEVAAAYEFVYEGYWECLRSPLDCDTSWLVEGSGSATAMQNTMQGLADRDRYVGDDPVGYYVIESIEFNDDQTEATVVTCWWSTAVLYTTPVDPTRPPGPDNPPTVVNDTPSSGFQSQFLNFIDGRWRAESGRLLDDGSRSDICGGEEQ